jgi:hypothetical protein
VPRGSPAAENEKEQISLPTAKIASLPLSWLSTSAEKLAFFNGLSKPSLILHYRLLCAK